jgi:hypothetical protein
MLNDRSICLQNLSHIALSFPYSLKSLLILLQKNDLNNEERINLHTNKQQDWTDEENSKFLSKCEGEEPTKLM